MKDMSQFCIQISNTTDVTLQTSKLLDGFGLISDKESVPQKCAAAMQIS